MRTSPEPQEQYWEPEWDSHESYREPEPYREPEREPRERYREPDRERREPSADRGTRFHGPSADGIGRTVQVISALIALVFVLHIVFVMTAANQGNDFVAFVYSVAKFFVFGLGDVFTPNDAMIGVALNYGLAAIIYLVVGRIIARALKR